MIVPASHKANHQLDSPGGRPPLSSPLVVNPSMQAGILLIFRQPFVAGDQIEVNDYSGTVIEITTIDGMTESGGRTWCWSEDGILIALGGSHGRE